MIKYLSALRASDPRSFSKLRGLFCRCGWPKSIKKTSKFSLTPIQSLSLSLSPFLPSSCLSLSISHSASPSLCQWEEAAQRTSKNCFPSCQVSKFHGLGGLHPPVKGGGEPSCRFLLVTSELILHNWFWWIYFNGGWVWLPLFSITEWSAWRLKGPMIVLNWLVPTNWWANPVARCRLESERVSLGNLQTQFPPLSVASRGRWWKLEEWSLTFTESTSHR